MIDPCMNWPVPRRPGPADESAEDLRDPAQEESELEASEREYERYLDQIVGE